MKPQLIFDICHERFVESKALLEHKIQAINPAACAKTAPRAALPRVAEYVADFEIVGTRVLRRKHRNPKPRIDLFVVYFCRLLPYTEAIRELKVRPGTFDWWALEIKKAVGGELAVEGLFPPNRYFREPWSLQKQRDEEMNAVNQFERSK